MRTKHNAAEIEAARKQVIKTGAQYHQARFVDRLPEIEVEDFRQRFYMASDRFDVLTIQKGKN